MTVRVRTLLIGSVALMVVLFLVALVYQSVFLGGKQRSRQQQSEALVFPEFEADRVTGIRFESEGRDILLQPDGLDEMEMPRWKQVRPIQAEGDGLVVNQLLGLLERLEVRLRLDLPADLKPFGLQPARARWTFQLHEGPSLSLQVGNSNSFDNGLYLLRQVGDERALLVVDGQRTGPLLVSAGDLRNRNLLLFTPDSVSGIRLDFPTRQVRLERHGLGFRIVRPYKDRADPVQVRKLLNILLAIQARRFLSPQAGGETALQVRLMRAGQEQPDTLKLTRPEEGGRLLARRTSPPGPLAEVDPRWLDTLNEVVERLRAGRLLQFAPAKVGKVKSFTPDALIVAERRQKGWDLVAPRPLEADGQRMQAMLQILAKLEVRDFVVSDLKSNRGRFGLEPPKRTIELYDTKNHRLAVLRIGKSDQADVFVTADDRPWICRIDGRALSQLPGKESDFLP